MKVVLTNRSINNKKYPENKETEFLGVDSSTKVDSNSSTIIITDKNNELYEKEEKIEELNKIIKMQESIIKKMTVKATKNDISKEVYYSIAMTLIDEGKNPEYIQNLVDKAISVHGDINSGLLSFKDLQDTIKSEINIKI